MIRDCMRCGLCVLGNVLALALPNGIAWINAFSGCLNILVLFGLLALREIYAGIRSMSLVDDLAKGSKQKKLVLSS